MPDTSRSLQRGRLFADADAPPQGERFDALLTHRNLVIERIVSSATPEPGEYVQAQDEWVVLLRGEATLLVGHERIELGEGDYLFLAAGTRHQVLHTAAGTLWLAVHLHPADG